METYKGFFDLCVPFEKDSKKLAKTLQEMYSCEYTIQIAHKIPLNYI